MIRCYIWLSTSITGPCNRWSAFTIGCRSPQPGDVLVTDDTVLHLVVYGPRLWTSTTESNTLSLISQQCVIFCATQLKLCQIFELFVEIIAIKTYSKVFRYFWRYNMRIGCPHDDSIGHSSGWILFWSFIGICGRHVHAFGKNPYHYCARTIADFMPKWPSLYEENEQIYTFCNCNFKWMCVNNYNCILPPISRYKCTCSIGFVSLGGKPIITAPTLRWSQSRYANPNIFWNCPFTVNARPVGIENKGP